MANSEFATRDLICTNHTFGFNLKYLLLVTQYSFGMQLRTMFVFTTVGNAKRYVCANKC